MTRNMISALYAGLSTDAFYLNGETPSKAFAQFFQSFGRMALGPGALINGHSSGATTSVTSNTIGTGAKTFAVTGLNVTNWAVGKEVQIYASPTSYMIGEITASSSTSITVDVTETSGSGTFASWRLSLVTRGSWQQYFDFDGTSISGWAYGEVNARLSVAVDVNIAANFAARTKNAGATDRGIAVTAFAVNDGALGRPVHAIYADAVRANDAAGNTNGMEINTATCIAITPPNPYVETAGEVTNTLRLGAGSDITVFGNTYAIGTFIHMIDNGAKAHAGIVIEHNALLRDGQTDTPGVADGAGYARAMKLGENIGISWYANDGGVTNEVARITSLITDVNVNARLAFTDTAITMGDTVAPEYATFSALINPSAQSGVRVRPGTSAGQAPTLESFGSQADLDISIDPGGPDGAGYLKYGTFNVLAAEALAGYVEIRTADNTVRKLAVVA